VTPVKDLVRSLVPPAVLNVIRRIRGRGARPQFSGSYASFAEARAAASKQGYESNELVEVALQRAREVRDARGAGPEWLQDAWAAQNLAAIREGLALRGRSTSLRVLDFGGGMGLHYFTLRHFLTMPGIASWTVCETATTAAVGASHFGDERLRFVSELPSAADRSDLAMASGSLQYVDDPARILVRLAEQSDLLLLNRLPLLGGGDRIALQSVGDIDHPASLPVWFFDEEALLGRLAGAGLSIRLRWWAPVDTVVFEDRPLVYQGLLAVRAA
jgi:putative methyltransferase (TIGR04325 family)